MNTKVKRYIDDIEETLVRRIDGCSAGLRGHEYSIDFLRARERETRSNLRELLQYLGLEIVDVKQEKHREVRKIEKEGS